LILGCKLFLPGSGTVGARSAYRKLCSSGLTRRKRNNAMPFVPVPDTIEVDVNYLLDAQIVQNTMYFHSDTGWDAASISAWLTEMKDLISSDLMPFLSSALELFELVGKLLDAASSISATVSLSTPVSGSDINSMLPNNATYTISFRTGLSGRSFRGRNYVPGLTSGSVSQNVIDSTTRTGILDFYTTLAALAVSEGYEMVVVSRYSGVDVNGDPIPRVTGVATPIVSFGTADFTVDSQRRRLPGRGS